MKDCMPMCRVTPYPTPFIVRKQIEKDTFYPINITDKF